MAIQQYNPPHPGALIRRTYIEPFERISANQIADRLKVARSTFSRLINEQAAISPAMAIKLSAVLGGTAESWMTLQESYDLWKARQNVSTEGLEQINFDQVA